MLPANASVKYSTQQVIFSRMISWIGGAIVATLTTTQSFKFGKETNRFIY